MSPRPSIDPGIASLLMSGAPARLVKKLDAEPALAEAWTWSANGDTWTVVTDKGETVSLVAENGIVSSGDAVRCTCLLSPRCLHILAVVARLPAGEAPVEREPPESSAHVASVDEDRQRAAADAFRAAASLLAAGADAAGALMLAELLRVIHGCRLTGAHRIAAAGTRVVRWIQELHADRPEFSLSGLTEDLRELLTAAYIVSRAPEVDTVWIGTARREYVQAGHLHLFGVFTEAVFARGGYAGAVTYLTDGNGRLYTRADVAPGNVERAVAAYDGSVAIGDAVLSHRELCRAGLFVSDATVSADGRLGAGASVKAVRAQAPSLWTDDPVVKLWSPPLPEQLARMSAAEDLPLDHRPAGWDLAFVEGVVRGVRGDSVALDVEKDAVVVQLVPGSTHERLRHRDNLVALGRLVGARVRAIGRIHRDQPRTLALVAVGPHESEELALSQALMGRANLAFDHIAAMAAPAPLASADLPPPLLDPLAALRRRIERASRGGVASFPPEAAREIAREGKELKRRMLGTAADLLQDLIAAAAPPDRTFSGIRRAPDPVPFATTWLRAGRFEVAARHAIARERWFR